MTMFEHVHEALTFVSDSASGRTELYVFLTLVRGSTSGRDPRLSASASPARHILPPPNVFPQPTQPPNAILSLPLPPTMASIDPHIFFPHLPQSPPQTRCCFPPFTGPLPSPVGFPPLSWPPPSSRYATKMSTYCCTVPCGGQ